MGQHLRRKPDDELFEGNQPGCMWGIIHALGYHHWHDNAKKMLPHKRHNGSRHTKGSGRPNTILNVRDSDPVQRFLDAEASQFIIDSSTTETSSTNKRWSLKACIKPLISEEISKEESSRRRDSRLHRTYSIHHVEPSDDAHAKFVHWSRPFIFLEGSSKSDTKKPVSMNEKFNVGATENVLRHLETKQLPENHTFCPEKCRKEEESSLNHCKEYVDVLDLFRVNKVLFSKNRKERDDGVANCLHDLQASHKQARFTKSGSFPSADLSGVRNFRPSKLKYKQTEVWSFPKGYKLSSGTHEIEGSINDLCDHKPTRIIRTPSVKTSLERYAQLFQNSFSREAKLNPSKSLKLTNEYEIPSGGLARISFKRVRSLSHFDSSSFQSELSCDGQFSGKLVNTVPDGSKNIVQPSHGEEKPLDIPAITEKCVSLEPNGETERGDISLKNEYLAILLERRKKDAIASMVGVGEEFDEQTVGENNLKKERPIQCSSQEDLTSSDDFRTPEGLEYKSGDVDPQGSPVESEHRPFSDTLSGSGNTTNVETTKFANKGARNQWHVEFFKNGNTDFDYVSVILHLSGFDGNACLEQWYSMDQPLNPLVFVEVEACWPHEPDFSRDEVFAHHQLLFDLTNEFLLQIYESSVTYYPKELSSSCRIHPMPMTSHLLQEVWARISRTLSSSQGLDLPVEGIVAQDLGKNDGWMNLQLETEWIALELEDLIFDELLEEILVSCDSLG